jgi:hypothetical protein
VNVVNIFCVLDFVLKVFGIVCDFCSFEINFCVGLIFYFVVLFLVFFFELGIAIIFFSIGLIFVLCI